VRNRSPITYLIRKGNCSAPRTTHKSQFGWLRANYSKWIYIAIAAFIVYLLYTTLTSPRQGNEGDRWGGQALHIHYKTANKQFRNLGSGGGNDGDQPGGRRPPPPGWNPSPPPPSYDETFGRKGSSQNSGSTGTGNSGPGFFTGLGLGALGGYLFGNRGGNDG